MVHAYCSVESFWSKIDFIKCGGMYPECLGNIAAVFPKVTVCDQN